MKLGMTLTKAQQLMVLDNLHLVPMVIRTKIHRNESVYGLGYDELLQEGYLLLCRAAATYDPSMSCFPGYAKSVIYNGLISHCRKVYQYEKRFTTLPFDANNTEIPIPQPQYGLDSYAQRVELVELIDLLSFFAQKYRGTTRKGIEALSWKLQGRSNGEIANYLQAPPNHVSAWISKAKQALRKNPEFINNIL